MVRHLSQIPGRVIVFGKFFDLLNFKQSKNTVRIKNIWQKPWTKKPMKNSLHSNIYIAFPKPWIEL